MLRYEGSVAVAFPVFPNTAAGFKDHSMIYRQRRFSWNIILTAVKKNSREVNEVFLPYFTKLSITYVTEENRNYFTVESASRVVGKMVIRRTMSRVQRELGFRGVGPSRDGGCSIKWMLSLNWMLALLVLKEVLCRGSEPWAPSLELRGLRDSRNRI